MIENKTTKKGALYTKNVPHYSEDEIKWKSAAKKQDIVDIITEGSQLTLLATIVEQIADKIELDTPEYIQAKEVFAWIRSILK